MNFIYKKEYINYDFIDTKNEDTILFLHGWGGNKNSFSTSFKILKSRYNIISPSLPTTDEMIVPWKLMDYVNLVLCILKTHNIKNVIIVCHSFGFRVATILKHFIKIKKLVVTGGAGVKRKNIFKRIENENNLILLKKKSNAFLYEKIASPDYLALSKTNKKTFKNIVNANTKNLLKFDCPLLLFWGKKDNETPLFIAKRLKRKNDAKLILTNDGHFAYLDSSSYFNNAIIEFLKS